MVIFVVFFLTYNVVIDSSLSIGNKCSAEKETRTVRGNSLEPLIKNGEEVEILFNFYECELPESGDLVIYSYSGNEAPLIKVIKATPGNQFQLIEKEENKWHIKVDEEVLKNSNDDIYEIGKRGYDMLSLYEDRYKKEGIPEKTYLLLSDSISGGVDSTNFGFVHKKDFLGKAIH